MNYREQQDILAGLCGNSRGYWDTWDLNTMAEIRRQLIQTQEQKVSYLNNLRTVVSRKCPKNKMGAALVSDYDLLDASDDEVMEALLRVFKRWEEKG